MRQPTYAFERISCPMCSRSSHLESGTLFPLSLHLAVLVPGVWVLLMSSKIGFFQRRLSSWVQCLVQQWIHVLRQFSGDFGRIYTFSTWWQTRFLKRCFSIRFEWRGVPSRCFGCCLALRGSHLETLDFFRFFAAQCGILSASSSELRPCQLMTMVLCTCRHS